MHIPILYQTADYVLINKPAGILVHRSWLDKHETVFLLQSLRNLLNQHVYPVHRLDRPTSGIMLFALNPDSARYFTQQFEQHQIQKSYLAIVRGWCNRSGSIDYPLTKQYDPIADKHAAQQNNIQAAQTDYHTLAQSELPFCSHPKFNTSRYSLVRALPKTGRKHQIRRHFKHIFHPIIGDTAHGDLKQNQAIKHFCGNERLLLHAESLRFTCPQSQEIKHITAPTDDVWQHTEQALQLFRQPERFAKP